MANGIPSALKRLRAEVSDQGELLVDVARTGDESSRKLDRIEAGLAQLAERINELIRASSARGRKPGRGAH